MVVLEDEPLVLDMFVVVLEDDKIEDNNIVTDFVVDFVVVVFQMD